MPLIEIVLIPDMESFFVLYKLICVVLVIPTKYEEPSIRGDIEVFELLL